MKFKVVNRCNEDLSSMHGLLKSFLPFARKRMGFNRPPTIFFKSDENNAKKLLGKTAYYDPSRMSITVYVTGRHPKDVLRSLSHELVHHAQNCRGEFAKLPETSAGYAQNDSHLRAMEEEAYREGNLCMRDWEDGVKGGKINIALKLQESLIREEKKTYVVVSGDTLSGIAEREYGEARKWPVIYLANQSLIGDNPNLIEVGMEFVIPPESDFDKLTDTEVADVQSKSSFQGKASPDAGKVVGAPIEVDETSILFPVRQSDRPSKYTKYGMRGPIKSLASKGDRYAKRHMHYGIDLGVPIGTPVVAPADGKIIFTRTGSPTAGNYIHLLHKVGENDYRLYRFLHLDRFNSQIGDNVQKGDVIAYSGNTGFGTAPHLHFEIRVGVNENGKGGKPVDPMSIYGTKRIKGLAEWKHEELNRLLLEKFNLGDSK